MGHDYLSFRNHVILRHFTIEKHKLNDRMLIADNVMHKLNNVSCASIFHIKTVN